MPTIKLSKIICKGVIFMKDSRTETQKLVHSFVSSIVALTGIVLIALGIFAAKNNTAAIESGITPAMIYAARDNEQIAVRIDKTVYEPNKTDKIPIDTLLSLAPAPVGGLYLIYENLTEYFLVYK